MTVDGLNDIIYGGVMFVLGICGASLCWVLHYSKRMDAMLEQQRALCVVMAKAIGGREA